MTNEAYWIIHELGESIIAENEYYIQKFNLKLDMKDPKLRKILMRIMSKQYFDLLEIHDATQKKGRKIV